MSKQEGATQDQAANQEQRSPRTNWAVNWTAAVGTINTAILTVVAVAGGIAVYQQLAEMKETNRLTRESLELAKQTAKESDETTRRALESGEKSARAAEAAAQIAREVVAINRQQLAATAALERADVVVEWISPLSLDSPFDPLTIRVRNIGRSPAQYIEIRTNANGQDEATERPCTWSRKRIAAIALGPGQEANHVTPRIKIAPVTANRILGQHAKMFLWFSISYTDAFGVKQEPPSCFVVTGTGMSNRLHPPTNPWRSCEITDFKQDARATCEQ